MKCPKCGMDLHTVAKGVVDIDVCFSCQGVWLDKGELESLIAHGSEKSGGVMKAVLNWFAKE
jgi:Zn-finger nucleic acid-binding protein